MAVKIKAKNILGALRSPAGQTAGKTAAVVGGATAAAFAVPTAAGAGLSNLGGGGEGIAGRLSGLLILGLLAVVAIIALPTLAKVIK